MESAATPTDKQPSFSVTNRPHKTVKIVIIGIVLLIFYTAIALLVYQVFFHKNDPKQFNTRHSYSENAISGTVGINGSPPEGSMLQILAKEYSAPNYETVTNNLTPVDGASWVWNGAKEGTEYDIIAQIVHNGTVIGTSESLVAIAPADNEALHINTLTETATTAAPAISTSPTGTPSSPAQASVISGSFNLNGYTPSSASISLQARPTGNGTFTQIGTYPATDNASWSWNAASQNSTYDIQATLTYNGTAGGQSQVMTVTAPATGEVLNLNSTLKPPAPTNTALLSGSFNINGSIPSGSTVSIGIRQTGSSSFNIVQSNLPAADGYSWSYRQATAGMSYDMQAYLIANGTTISSSQILTAAAPATGETLTLNAQPNQPPAPGASLITNHCNNSNSNSQWQVQFTINGNQNLTNVQQIRFTAGTSTGDGSLVNVTLNPTNNTATYTTGNVFNQGQTYFAQWSYATCANCGNFSQNSPSLQFYCNPSPTNTPSPIPTPTNTPVPPTATHTPTVAPTLIITTNTPTPTSPPVTSTPASLN